MTIQSPRQPARLKQRLQRVGLIGLGRQGQEHLAACQQLADENKLEFAGACDPNPNRFTGLPDQGEALWYTDIKAFFSEACVDAVIIAVPNDHHFAVTTQALLHGAHVLKEKPFALNLRDASTLAALAGFRRLTLRVAQQRAFHPDYERALEWSRSIGTPQLVDYKFYLNDKVNSWYWTKAAGGGCWHGLGWHGCWALSQFGFTAKEVSLRQLTGQSREYRYDTDDRCYFTATAANGASGQMHLSVVHPHKNEELFVGGEHGSLSLNRDGVTLFDRHGRVIAEKNQPSSWQEAYKRQIEAFLTDIKSGAVSIDPVSWRTIQMHSAAIRSAATAGASVPIHDALENQGNASQLRDHPTLPLLLDQPL